VPKYIGRLHTACRRFDVDPPTEDDFPVHERRSERSRPTGYLVVLIGAMGFVVSCFLPYLDYQVLPSQPGPPSLYRLIMLSSRTLAIK
jgi:hypothetical protein